MKKTLFICFVLTISMLALPLVAQTENDTTLLGLPGDNLDLFAVLNLFQKSKTIEEFEKSLNEEKSGINNLDLNLDNKVDFIKVVTNQKDQDFSFILQVDVNEKEIQDVAVVLVSKDKDGKVTMQIVGDEDLYGKGYVVEPRAEKPPTVTPNPAYTGDQPVTVTAPATTTTTTTTSTTNVVVVESAPIVQYVYSPVYVPYYPPYHYAYYPPYFAAFTVMAVSVYHHNNYYHHGAYYGGHGNTVVIHNTNNYNNYNNSRNTSNTVNHNNASGNYNRNNTAARPSTTGSSASARPSASPSASQSKGASASPSSRQSASQSTNASRATTSSSQASSSARSSSSSSSSSRSSYSSGSASRSSSRSGGGGGRRR